MNAKQAKKARREARQEAFMAIGRDAARIAQSVPVIAKRYKVTNEEAEKMLINTGFNLAYHDVYKDRKRRDRS